MNRTSIVLINSEIKPPLEMNCEFCPSAVWMKEQSRAIDKTTNQPAIQALKVYCLKMNAVIYNSQERNTMIMTDCDLYQDYLCSKEIQQQESK